MGYEGEMFMKKKEVENSDEALVNKWDLMFLSTGEDHNSVSVPSLPESSSENSISSLSSSEMVEDASSTNCSSSSSSSNGPLYELSELMAQLPIKRGLSNYYQGKSQSFTSLARVESVEDLAKKVNPRNIRTKMKSCKSYVWGMEAQNNRVLSPKGVISKKGSSPRSCLLSSLSKRSGSMVNVNLPFSS